jgi:hypothetical protein
MEVVEMMIEKVVVEHHDTFTATSFSFFLFDTKLQQKYVQRCRSVVQNYVVSCKKNSYQKVIAYSLYAKSQMLAHMVYKIH